MDMSEKIKSEKISRRRALKLVAALGFAVPALTISGAEAQTPGMQRREDRREGRSQRREDRRDRRDDRRDDRSQRREDRRTPGTTGSAPAAK
jgi:hypothetical protein